MLRDGSSTSPPATVWLTVQDDTYEIGYREDGVMWVTASSDVPDAEAAERYLGSGWYALREEFMAPTGLWLNSRDPEWAVCEPDAPGARQGWRLVDTEAALILDSESGEEIANPHYGSVVPERGEGKGNVVNPTVASGGDEQQDGSEIDGSQPKRRR